jgi:hypothetical protein
VIEGAANLADSAFSAAACLQSPPQENLSRLRAIREAHGIWNPGPLQNPPISMPSRDRKTKLIDGFKEYRVKGTERRLQTVLGTLLHLATHPQYRGLGEITELKPSSSPPAPNEKIYRPRPHGLPLLDQRRHCPEMPSI